MEGIASKLTILFLILYICWMKILLFKLLNISTKKFIQKIAMHILEFMCTFLIL